MPVNQIGSPDPGVLTLALGDDSYISMAKNLVRSIRWHSPEMPIAVGTDRPESFNGENVRVVKLDVQQGDFLGLKLRLPEFTPFQKTIFIDGDCLVTRSLCAVWSEFHRDPVTVWGWKVTDGVWYAPVKPWRERLGLDYIAQHNSGVILFDKSEASRRVFSRAYQLHCETSSETFPDVHGLKSDEPALGVALAEAGMQPIDDGGRLTRTHLGMTGPLKIDVVAGVCKLNSYGSAAEPAIFHACAWRNHAIYKREALCLWLATRLPRPFGQFVGKIVRLAYFGRSACGNILRGLVSAFSKQTPTAPVVIRDSKLQEFLASRGQA